MSLDASIYGNIKPVEVPDFMGSMQKAMALKQLGLQNQQMDMQMQTQAAMRDAYQRNMGPDGKLNQQGFLSDVGRVNPQAAMSYQEQLGKANQASAQAQKEQIEAHQQKFGLIANALDYLGTVKPGEKPAAYQQLRAQLIQQGAITPQDAPETLDQGWVDHTHALAMKTKSYLDNQKTQAETAQKWAETEKIRSETFKRNPQILGQTNDPAKLVPNMVPKEHQAKAFAEIDAAENTRRMSQSILDSFEQAAKENTVMRTGAGLVRTPASVLALHQAMQPTFKDLEGTVRQAAMDNTFKNITPAPGDSEHTIETKRQALADYLQSKLSAPTARAYGIDLSKYPSTATYATEAGQKSGRNSDLVDSANAGPPKITARDAQALQWVKDPKNASSPDAFHIRAKLKAKGML